jgi:hypothetical protein
MKFAYTEIKQKESGRIGRYACLVNEKPKPEYKSKGYNRSEHMALLEWQKNHIEIKFFDAQQEILIETHIRSESIPEHIDMALIAGVETDCVVVIEGKAHFKMPVYKDLNKVEVPSFMLTFIRVSNQKLECVCNEYDFELKNYDEWLSKSTIIKFSDEDEEHKVFRYTINEFRKRDNTLSMSTMLTLGIKTDCISIENSVAKFKKPLSIDERDAEDVLNTQIYNVLFSCFLHGRDTVESFKDYNDRNNVVEFIKTLVRKK